MKLATVYISSCRECPYSEGALSMESLRKCGMQDWKWVSGASVDKGCPLDDAPRQKPAASPNGYQPVRLSGDPVRPPPRKP